MKIYTKQENNQKYQVLYEVKQKVGFTRGKKVNYFYRF